MATLELLYPFKGTFPETQSFDEHVARAKANGWSYAPGIPGNGYYYGGVDWGMPKGTPILATRRGEVEKTSKDLKGYGYHIRLLHETVPGLTKSIYAHLSEILVSTGDVVQAGQHIGNSGNTGNSTGAHIHYEVRRGGTPFDPVPFLVKQIGDLPPVPPTTVTGLLPAGLVKVISNELRLRSDAGIGFFIAGILKAGAVIDIEAEYREASGYTWRKLVGQQLYIAELLAGTGERYLEVV